MQNILITGYPRAGKTTLIKDVVANLSKTCIGMITNEIRGKGQRIGFKIETLSGSEFILASKSNLTSKYRVASYGVFLENINKVVELVEEEIQETDPEIIIIDEIGKMELFSNPFKKFLNISLDSRKVLGTIMLKDNNFSKTIKNRSDTEVFQLTRENRDIIKQEIIERLS